MHTFLNCFLSKFYEPTAILADPVNGPVVANLLGIVYHFPNTTVAYAPLENEVGIRQY